MNRWEALRYYAATLDPPGVNKTLLNAPNVPPSVICSVFHGLWRASRTGGSPKDIKKMLILLADHGVNPLVLNDVLEPFVADWNTSLHWLEYINHLAYVYKWKTWSQGGLLHSVCVNGAFHLKSVEHLLRSSYTVLDADVQGNTPWHILWKEGQLEHLGYIHLKGNYPRLDSIQRLFENHHCDLYVHNTYGENVRFLMEQRIEQMIRFHPHTQGVVQKMWSQYIRSPLAQHVIGLGVDNERKKI